MVGLGASTVRMLGLYVIITHLQIVMKPCAPIKDADYKVTISTNKPAVSLLDLFPEFVLDSTMANAAGFCYFGGPRVTLLSSKTSQRYRLQSDDLPALWPLTREIEVRLQRMHTDRGAKESSLQCSYSASLPMHEYFSEIETHFHKREKMKQLGEQLAQRTTQFRCAHQKTNEFLLHTLIPFSDPFRGGCWPGSKTRHRRH